MITPTVGRVVWYHPHGYTTHDEAPFAAIIAYVHDGDYAGKVNLAWFDRLGKAESAADIRLWQGGDDPAPGLSEPYCEWMPYQKGQAAKTEALEAAAK